MLKRNLSIIIAVGMVLLWAWAAYPGETDPAPDHPLTLADCIRIALDKNPSHRIALEGVISTKETVGETRAPYYPELGLQTAYKRWQGHAFLPSGLSIPGRTLPTIIGPTDDWMAGLNARYTLFDSGRRQAEYQSALARQGVAEEEKARIVQDLIFSVYQGFYGLAAAMETLTVAGKNLNRARDHVRLAQERKAAGAVSRADVLRVQVEASNAELDLVRAQSLVRISRGNLNTAMGLSAEGSLEVDTETGKIDSPDSIDLLKALDQAIHKRPEIKAALKRIEAQQGGVEAARSTFGPKVRAEGSYGWRDSNFLPKDEEWLAGIIIEWPLFTGFSRKHRLARAKAEVFKEEAEAKRLQLRVKQEVLNAHSRLKENYEAVQTTKMLIQNAEESLRMARERYAVGAGTVTDLLDAQTALARAQATQVEAGWDYHLAQAVFQRSLGLMDAKTNP
ncbi:MAG: TolC family protein [Deltaproteobacteria bacterium]|nr:TolC family protein [Deltaproteobacteria bacterium]